MTDPLAPLTALENRKALLYLAGEIADLSRGVDTTAPGYAVADEDHNPETCDVCAMVADRLEAALAALRAAPPET